MRHPFPFQDLAIDWLSDRRVAILALEMGLGKTLVAIRAADSLGLRRILVICPAVAITNWIREFQVGQTMERTVGGVYHSKDRPGTDVVIVNYDKISRNSVADLVDRKWDLLIADEGHALKTQAASRTKRIYGRLNGPPGDPRRGGLVSRAEYCWILTATPIPNHLGEIWTHVRALAPELLPLNPNGRPLNYWQFTEKYCECRDTPFGRQIVGNRKATLPEVQAMLKPIVLRVKKVDVLPDLPPIRYVTTVVEAREIDPALRNLEHHPEILDLYATLEAARAKVELDGRRKGTGTLRADEAADLLAALDCRPGHIATLRRMTSLVKVDPAIQLLADELESGALAKVIVFAVHRETVDRLAEGLGRFGSVKLYGGTPPRARQAAIDDFQGDPEVRVFVGQIQACGTAINLTAASDVVFVESSWVPSDNSQAASRAHRIGTRGAVLVRFLALAGSVDELVQDALARKTAAIDQVLNEES
jgi:SWI/SNF-related matrix-associated actin-dependent regulator of chromatin subfamily A-like protein 1